MARANSESKLTLSESSFNFLDKRVVFCTLYPRRYMAGGSAPQPPLHPPVLLSAAGWDQKVNYVEVKDLNLLFFVYFIWKWGKIFEELYFFTFGPKQCFYLIHAARVYFEKLAFKKKAENATLTSCISKSRANSESKVTFPESSFNFLKKVFFSPRSSYLGTRQDVPLPTTPGAAVSSSPSSKS